MIGRSGLTALMLAAGVLPRAEIDDLRMAAEQERQTVEIMCVTGWSFARAHDAMVRARVFGVAHDDVIAAAREAGPDGVVALLERAEVSTTVDFEPAPPSLDIDATVHSFRVGDRLARRLGGRR